MGIKIEGFDEALNMFEELANAPKEVNIMVNDGEYTTDLVGIHKELLEDEFIKIAKENLN